MILSGMRKILPGKPLMGKKSEPNLLFHLPPRIHGQWNPAYLIHFCFRNHSIWTFLAESVFLLSVSEAEIDCNKHLSCIRNLHWLTDLYQMPGKYKEMPASQPQAKPTHR